MIGIANGHGAGIAYLSRTGGSVPIVLLHGIGSQARSFVPLMEAFDRTFSLLAWDAPGYGGSPPLAVDWPDASDYAVALNRLLAHLRIARFVLVGQSLGALMAARFALVSPNRVVRLCLVSPAQGYGCERGAPLPEAAASRLNDLEHLGPAKFAAKRAPNLVGDPQARPDVLQEVERIMAMVRRPGYDQATRMLASGRLLEDVAKLGVPTAVMVGALDRVTPPEAVRRVFEALPPAARLAYGEFAGAGHAICQEQPFEIARAITSIVRSEVAGHG